MDHMLVVYVDLGIIRHRTLLIEKVKESCRHD